MSRAWRLFTAVLILAGMAAVTHIYITFFSTGQAPIGAVIIGGLTLLGGSVALYVHSKPPPDPTPRPHVQIDWAVQETCLRFACTCTPNELVRVCEWTFGRLRCDRCGRTYQLPERLEALLIE